MPAHQGDLPILGHPGEKLRQLPQTMARLLMGAAESPPPRLLPAGGRQLLLEASGSPGSLGHQPAGMNFPEHSQVQLLGKGALHRHEPPALKAQGPGH